MPSQKPTPIYYPPKDEHIEKYAYKVCRLLDETYANGLFTTENVREVENFLKIVAQITAKRLNKRNQNGANHDKQEN